MRIPLTRYGWPEVVVFPAVVLAVMVVLLLVGIAHLPLWTVLLVEAVLAVVLLWLLSFFRDPYRLPPLDSRNLLAPADGRITDIEILDEDASRTEPTLRIGIFLSIFDAHINRAPCNVRVEKIAYKKGLYKNAKNPESAKVNESNDVHLVRTDNPRDKLIVRQISGAIARRIVCETRQGRELAGGEKFGMIKFGSRTELYVPIRQNQKCLAEVGDKIKAGVTVLVRYE